MTQSTKKIPKSDSPPVNRVRFVIFARLPSYHELESGFSESLIGNRQKARIRKKYKELFFWAIKEGFQLAGCHHPGNTPYFKNKIKADLIIHNRWQRLPDEDNYIYSAGKLIIEQFFQTRARYPAVHLLVDDSIKYFEWGEVTLKQGRPMVEVTLTEIENNG
jgi:hypothetical protein